MAQDVRNFINGEWCDARSGERGANVNPATGETVGQYAKGGVEDARAAIAAARAALPAWRSTPPPVRGRVLERAARLMEERKDALAMAMTLEEGKTLGEAAGEVQKSINVLEFVAGEARRLNGETIPSEMPRTFAYTVRQPLGVVAVITPWNFPLCIPTWKIAPALVGGNTVVFKPASLTPLCAQLLTQIFADAGAPRGTLNLVLGSGASVGQTLVEAPETAALSFTGSNDVGTALYRDGASRGKKVQCEMGGKNALVLLRDGDVELAAVAAAQGAFGSSGQRCTATSRAVVERAVHDQFVAALKALAAKVVVGDGTKPGVTMGPVVDEGQLRTVLEYVEVGRKEARLVFGGERLTEAGLAKGWFVAPTLFTGVHAEHRIAQEEIFGPVLSVLAVDSFEEALEVANGVRYGLSSSLYTRDLVQAQRFIDEVETGIVHINSPTVGGEAQLPFGGMKATGVGQREMGKTAVDFYTEWKTVYVDYTGTKRETNIY
ncbi:MAG TPA: aldehyde dehydrogenase family protein [Myxococcota bacterium]|jgi:aldehyde dehydrogenase (NAD+)|nr:aldehyde dehydrogenase family protein [Myxococcota bacterium]